MATQREIERKYEVPAEFSVPDLIGVAGVSRVDEPVRHELEATYYDTETLRLARSGAALRRRTGGGDAGWHVKRRVDDGDRTEYQVRPDDGADVPAELPHEIDTEIRAVRRGEALRPIATVRTTRLERALRADDGTILAVIDEDTVTARDLTNRTGDRAAEPDADRDADRDAHHGGERDADHGGERDETAEDSGRPGDLRWHEVEVEIVDGPADLIDQLDQAMRVAGARPAAADSKLARILGVRLPAPPIDDSARHGKGWQALIGYVREQRDVIERNDPAVRRDEPESVHDMRVATRRLRSTLRTFGSLFDPARTGSLLTELHWLAGELGEIRDREVMAARLRAALDREPAELIIGSVAGDLDRRLRHGVDESRARLLTALDSDRYAALLDGLDELIRTPPFGRVRAGTLRKLARKAVERADRRLADADRAEGADRELALHRGRRAYKRGRYAVEVLGPLDGKPARRLARELSRVQDVLGTYQDTIVTRELLREYAVAQDSGDTFTYGVLYARQEQEAERVLAALPAARRQVRRRKPRRFLG